MVTMMMVTIGGGGDDSDDVDGVVLDDYDDDGDYGGGGGDYYDNNDNSDIHTHSMFNVNGSRCIHNRNHNHVTSDRNYIIAIISIHNYITNCYQQ